MVEVSGTVRGRRVVVTGASSGIGSAVARAVAAEGGRVALLARRADRLDALVAEFGDQVFAVPCDITDDVAVTEAVHESARRLGGLDALVNAAGIFTLGGVADTDPAAWRAMFEVNVLGLLVTTQAAVPHLRRGTAPSVVNVSSMAGRRVPRADGGVYAATKFAVHALGEALRMELNSDGIRVTTVAPGMVDTEITEDWPDSAAAEQFRERLSTRGLSADTVAAAVVHVLGLPPEANVVEYAVMSTSQ